MSGAPGEATRFLRLVADAAAVAGLLWSRRWAERNAGNLSCDVTGVPLPAERTGGGTAQRLTRPVPELAGRRLLVTAAGTRMRDLAREPEAGLGVLEFDARGAAVTPVWTGGAAAEFAPTSELPAHLAIHAALRRRDSACRAIVHAHPGELLALSHDPLLLDEARLNALLWSVHPETVVVVPAGVAVVPYALPGSEAQGEVAGSAMAAHEVALWEKHGAVAVGGTLAEAFDLIDTVNSAARLVLLCRAAGYEPEGLTPARVAELRRAYPAPSVR